jgi:hypothetical protein
MTACGETCVNLSWGWTKTKFHMCEGRCIPMSDPCSSSAPPGCPVGVIPPLPDVR